jgi:hypothetical protein
MLTSLGLHPLEDSMNGRGVHLGDVQKEMAVFGGCISSLDFEGLIYAS